jgi:hypothetical protein
LIAVFLVATVFAASVSDHEYGDEIVILENEVTDEMAVLEDEIINENPIIEDEVIEEPNVNVVVEEEEDVEEDEGEQEEPNPLPQAGNTKLVIGSDSDQYPGQGFGYLYRSGSTYRSYDRYSMYTYISGTTRVYRGWAVYDLSDLQQFNGISITSGEIWWRHDYRRNAGQLDFWSMNSIPRDGVSGSTAKGWHEEVGGPGSVRLGTNMFSGTYNSNNFDVTTTLTSGGISWLNSKLSSGDYDVSFGADISSLNSGTYGYVYCYDVRLVLYVTYTDADSSESEVAVGDELSGYAYRTGSNYDIGRLYTSSSYYGAYAVWDPQVVMDMIPSDGNDVTINKVSVRLNSPYGYLATLRVRHMDKDPRIATGQQLYDDAFDGTTYVSIPSGGYTSSPAEHEWDLGSAGLTDFIGTLDGSPNFFALGFSRTSNYNYMYSPKLVIEYEIDVPSVGGPTAVAGPDMTSSESDTVHLDGSASYGNLSQIVMYEWDFESDGIYDYSEGKPPTDEETLRLGADNPERKGQAMGYARQSGSSYYIYSYYYTYIYRSGSTDYHGWTTFDLADLKKWSGATVTDAKLLIHNYYRYYIDEVGFTALSTTPYYGAPTAVRQAVFQESGPTGTQIGEFDSATTSDSSRHAFEVDLNSDGVAAINAVLSGSPTYYTFGVGLYVKSLHAGYSYGYARWTDIRLVLTFAVSDELQSTQSGDGIAFGDDWSGHLYRYSSNTPSDRPYGYMYYRKSTSYEYRAYSQWDVSTIASVLPDNPEIKNVALRFNHRYSSKPGVYVRPMTNDVQTASSINVWTDIGDGTPYVGPKSLSSSYNEYEWDLGSDGVNDLQYALDNNIGHFALGFSTTSTSGYTYDFSPRLVIEWDSQGGGGVVADGKTDHVFGDNGVYTVTLRVTDAMGMRSTDTCDVTVNNVAPTITPFGPFTVDEGTPLTVTAEASDIGSDDLTFQWEFELSTTYTNIHYCDGVGPDPMPSPYGIFPMTTTDTVTHSQGDNGIYTLVLSVIDDDFGMAIYSTTVTVLNVAPAISPFGPFSVSEGSSLAISATTTDLGSDDLTFEWVYELGPTFTTTFFNDGTGPDPVQSPMGSFPFVITDTTTHTYGDNAVYDLTLTVTDDDGAASVYSTTITVINVAPSVSLNAYVNVDVTLRVSGEKWHDVEVYVLRNSYTLGYVRVLRMPGDPDDQSITLTDVMCDVTMRVTTKVVYTPFDDVINGQINGADPVWVTLTFENGDEFTYDHTFNYNHPERWEWNTNINEFFVGHEMIFEGTATDPGSDDLTFLWEWGDLSFNEGAMYYNDGAAADPAKSPDGTFPFTVMDPRKHTYWTPVNHTLKLTVTDDDGGVTILIVTIWLT